MTKSTGTKSLLAAMMKEKQTAKPQLPRLECGVTVDAGLVATVVEADEVNKPLSVISTF